MAKLIPVQIIVNASGRPHRIPVRDLDGDVVWEAGKAPCDGRPGDPKRAPANTLTLLRLIMIAKPAEVQKVEDGNFAPRLYASIDRAWDLVAQREATLAGADPGAHELFDGTVRLEVHDKIHTWLMRLLDRKLPQGKEERDMGIPQQTYAMWLFTADNAGVIKQQLMDANDLAMARSDDALPDPS